MFKAAQEMLKVGRDIARSLANQPPDLRDCQRAIQEQRDKVLSEHSVISSRDPDSATRELRGVER